MSATRARAIREKNAVVKAVGDLTKKMEGFEAAVEELKIMKEGLIDMNDQIVSQEIENNARLAKLREELKENKNKVLNEAADEAGKILMSKEELEELKDEAQKWRTKHEEAKKKMQAELKKKVEAEVQRQVNVLTLRHECKTAELSAANANYEKEIAHLKEAMDRMSNELESQKKLTGTIAGGGRRIVRRAAKKEEENEDSD